MRARASLAEPCSLGLKEQNLLGRSVPLRKDDTALGWSHCWFSVGLFYFPVTCFFKAFSRLARSLKVDHARCTVLVGHVICCCYGCQLLPMFEKPQTPTVPSHVGDGFICSFLSGEGIILLAVSEKCTRLNTVQNDQNYIIGIKYITWCIIQYRVDIYYPVRSWNAKEQEQHSRKYTESQKFLNTIFHLDSELILLFFSVFFFKIQLN